MKIITIETKKNNGIFYTIDQTKVLSLSYLESFEITTTEVFNGNPVNKHQKRIIELYYVRIASLSILESEIG